MDPTRILSEDMLLDVLRRLPPASLAVSRCVCKAWCATVDDRRADLLTPLLEGIFLELFETMTTPGYRRQEFPIPVLFSRPSTGRKIPIDIGYADNWIDYERSIIDCCNGLLLLRNDRVVNPATRQWAQVPNMTGTSFLREWNGCSYTKYLVFDPTVSPHYEVFAVPEIPANLFYRRVCNHSRKDKSISAMEWPPSPYVMDVFSSRTGDWEDRWFVREGKAAGTVADCNVYTYYKGAAYWNGALYLNCEPNFVLRIKLPDNRYQVIEMPEEMKGFNERRLGKSEKGVYCAYRCADQVFQIWFLDESGAHTEWEFKSDINLNHVLPPSSPRDFAWGSWTLLQQDDNDEAQVLEENSEWDPDDKDVISTEHWVACHGRGVYDFLGFHPFKEIAILTSGSQLVIACHLNTPKVRSLGRIYSSESDIQLAFPYTPCWMGPLPGASEHCLENKQVVHENNQVVDENKEVAVETNETVEGRKIQWQDWTDGKTDEEGFTPVLSRRTRKQIRSAAKVSVGRAQSKSSAGSLKISINHPSCDILA